MFLRQSRRNTDFPLFDIFFQGVEKTSLGAWVTVSQWTAVLTFPCEQEDLGSDPRHPQRAWRHMSITPALERVETSGSWNSLPVDPAEPWSSRLIQRPHLNKTKQMVDGTWGGTMWPPHVHMQILICAYTHS